MKEHVRAEFVDSVARHRHNLQTFSVTHCLVFIMLKKIENPTACEMWSVILFLNVKNMKPAEIRRQICDLYVEHAMSSSVVWRWVSLFNEGQKVVHDDLWSSLLSLVNEDLVHAVEEKTDDSPLHHFPCIFHKFRCHFFTKLCLINLSFRSRVHTGC